MSSRCCKALPLHIKFRLGIFTIVVDNIQQRINFRACCFQNHLLNSHAWLSFKHCNGVRGKNIICLWALYIDVVHQNANDVLLRQMLKGKNG